MGDMMKKPPEEEKPTARDIIVGFVLTVFALPFLVVGTCLPAIGVTYITGPAIAVVAWVVGVLTFGVWRAVVTKNPGVRWGIIAIIVASVIFAALWFFPDTTGIHILR
jgi:hypothetical protein